MQDWLVSETRRAYDASGAAWARDASVVYDRLAEAVVSCWPGPLDGRVVLDLGAGTGAASRAIEAAGGIAVAADAAVGMLRHYDGPAVAGDAAALPVRSGAVDGAVATFSLTHVPDPVVGFREAARVVVPGGPVLASAFRASAEHPVRAAVEAALAGEGWSPPAWYTQVRGAREQEAEMLFEAAAAAGLADVTRIDLDVDTGVGDPRAMVACRLAMAHSAPFVATLPPVRRAALVRRAVESLRGAPPLVLAVAVILGSTRPH